MSTTTIRVNTISLESAASMYESKQQGVDRCLAGYLSLQIRTIYELKGIFEGSEIKLLADAFNGTLLSPDMMHKSILIAQIEDAEQYDNLGAKWEVNIPQLVDKAKTLTNAQAYFLIDEIYRFWNVPDAYGSPDPDLDKLLSLLS